MARKRARSTTVRGKKSGSEAYESKAVEISSKQDAEPATNGLGEPHPSDVGVEDVEEMNVSSSAESEDNSDEDGDDDDSQEGEEDGGEYASGPYRFEFTYSNF